MSPTDIFLQNDQKIDLLKKTAAFYRRSIDNYRDFARTERNPRTKRQLEQRLKTVLQEIETLEVHAVA